MNKVTHPLKRARSTVYEMIRVRSGSALYVLNMGNLSQSNQFEDLYERVGTIHIQKNMNEKNKNFSTKYQFTEYEVFFQQIVLKTSVRSV